MFSWISVKAQINEGDTARYHIQMGLTGFIQSGNVELLTVRTRSEFLYAFSSALVLKSQNISLYQRFGKFKVDEDLLSRNFVYWNPSTRLYPFLLTFIQTNYRRKIDYRWYAGVGGTLQLMMKKHHTIKVSVGLLKESTQFSSTSFSNQMYNGSNTINLWRLTTYLLGWHTFMTQPISLFYTVYWQPAMDSIPNHRLQAEISSSVQLFKNLQFIASYLIAYEQVTASGIKPTDTIFTFGITYNVKG
jgi:hypothetical protein